VAKFLKGPGRWLVLFAVVGIGAFLLRDRMSSNNASKLVAGDCFNVPTSTTVSDVQHQPCTEPHDGEVLLVADYPADKGAAYPATTEFLAWAEKICIPAFAAYTGTSFDTADAIDMNYLRPTTDGWKDDNQRRMTCFMTPVPAGTKVTASYRTATPSK
jgi:hypothetical protein